MKTPKLTNGCWVVLSIAMCASIGWDRMSCVAFHTLSYDDSAAYHVEEDATTKKYYCWVCINHLVQCDRLIFSVILHIFLMFTQWLNISAMFSITSCMQHWTPCKSSVHVTVYRAWNPQYCNGKDTSVATLAANNSDRPLPNSDYAQNLSWKWPFTASNYIRRQLISAFHQSFCRFSLEKFKQCSKSTQKI